MSFLKVKLWCVITAIVIKLTQIDGNPKMSFNTNLHKVQESGSECILKLTRQFISPASIISIMSSGIKAKTNRHTGITTEQLILKKLMNETNWTLMTKTATSRTEGYADKSNRLTDDLMFSEKVHAYILFVRTQNDLAAILVFLKKTTSWNPHANFILYMDIGIDDKNIREILLVNLFNLAWTYLVINLVIIVPDTEKYNQQIITWFPFDEGNCGKQETRMHILGVCEASELIPSNINYFPVKVPNNLNKCVVKVGTVIWPPFIMATNVNTTANYSDVNYIFENGVEVNIIKTIATHANFTIKFNSSKDMENWGTIEHNGTGLIAMLMRKDVEIAFATFTPSKVFHDNFDFSIQYTQDKTTWVVPTPDLVPQWQSLVEIFQPQAWIASFFIYVVVSIVTCLLGMSSNKKLEHTKFCHFYGTFLIIWRIMCGSGSPTFPKTAKIKLFLLLWLLYCMHWCTAYTTSLICMLTTPIYNQGMSSFNDIVASRIEYGMQLSTTRYFQKHASTSDYTDDILIKNYKLCVTASSCLDRIATKRDFAMAISRQYFEFIERKYKDQSGNSLIKAFHNDIVTSPVEMLMIKGHPLLPRIDGILLQIVQAGLVDFWTQQIIHDASLQNIESTNKLESSQKLHNKKVLTFYHLQGAFMALGIGLLIAFIQFMLEILVNKWQTTKIKY